jgi:hypothetical protein
MPPQYVLFDSMGDFELSSETKLLHFWWGEKDVALAQMESCLAAVSAGQSFHDLDLMLRRQLDDVRLVRARALTLPQVQELTSTWRDGAAGDARRGELSEGSGTLACRQ